MENPSLVPPVPPAPPTPPVPPEAAVPLMPVAPPAPPAGGAVQATPSFGFGALLRRAFSIWRVQWLKSLLLMLRGFLVGALFLVPPLVLYGVISYMMSASLAASADPAVGPPAWMRAARAAASVFGILGVFAVMFVQIKYGLAHLHLIAGADERLGVGGALQRVKGRFWAFLLFGFLSSLVAFGAMLLLAIPWFIWLPTFILAPWIFVVEGRKGMDVLVQSRRWVKGDGLSVVFHLLALGILIAIGNGVFGLISKSGGAGVAVAVAALTGIIQVVFLLPFQNAFSYAIYEALKAKKGPTPPELPKQRKYFIAATIAGILVIPVLMLVLGLALRGYAKKWSEEAASFRQTAPTSLQDFDAAESEPASATTTSPQDAAGAQASDADAPEADPDGDGMTNRNESFFQTDPNDPDTDGDGLGDYDERFRITTSPTNADTDGDGYTDGAEIVNGFDPKQANEPLSDAYRSNILRFYPEEYHEPTLTTLRPIAE